MKASSESGLWALTISREATDVIRMDGAQPSLQQCELQSTNESEKKPTKYGKGGHLTGI
jgi:hypothetical protein